MILVKNKIIIIVSLNDEAGQNMKDSLLEKREYGSREITPPETWPAGQYIEHYVDNISILEIPEAQIFTDYLTEGIECDLLLFASKHSSGAGQKALLVHTTGIWQKESGHGGRDHELAFVPSNLLSHAYNLIKKYQEVRDLEYWTGIECTHHGPTTLPFPIAFFEAGGTIDEWRDKDACQLIADVIDDTVTAYLSGVILEQPAFIGIGGNHYCSRFIKVLDTGNFGLGHVLPKYAIDDLPLEMLKQAYDKTLAPEKQFILDKRGMRASDRDRFIAYIEENGWTWSFDK